MKQIHSNWKMYLDFDESTKLINAIAREQFDSSKVNIGIFPNVLNFVEAVEKLADTDIAIGAQNVNWTPQGAYTGAASALLFKQAGAKYALVGHSERRYIFNESDEATRKKVDACFDVGIIPILCIGETQEDLDNNKKEYRLKKQLTKALEGSEITSEIIIAYEPVWAISEGGQGKPCTPADADDVHGWIKNEMKQYTDEDVSVIYGGSVGPDNVVSYVEREVIDGVLVGSASTKFSEFVDLVRKVETM